MLLVGLGAFLIVTPHLTPESVRLYDLKRILQVALLVAAAAVPLLSIQARSEWIHLVRGLGIRVDFAIVAFLAIGVVSAALSPDPTHAFLEVVHFALLLIAVVAVAALHRSAPGLVQKVLLSIVFGAASLYIVAFFRDYAYSQLGLGYSFRKEPDSLWPWAEFLGFAHARYLNQFQTWTLPLLVVPFLTVRKQALTSVVCFSVPALWWMLLFASGGRGTVLSVSIAGLFIIAVSGRTHLRQILVLAGTAAAGALLYWLLFKILGDTSASLADRDITSSMGRFRFWQHALELLRFSPVLGIGPGQYAWFHDPWAAHPHNAFFQILSEWGPLATALLVGVVLAGLVKIIPVLKRSLASDYVFVALAASIVAGLCHSMLSGLIVTPVSQLMMVVVIGWLWSEYLTSSDREMTKPTGPTRLAHAAYIVVALVLISAETSLTVATYQRLTARRAAVGAAGHRELPRFWVYGCPRDHDNRYPLLPRDRE